MQKKREKKYHKDKKGEREGGEDRHRQRREGKTCLRCNITITNEAAGLLIHAKRKREAGIEEGGREREGVKGML